MSTQRVAADIAESREDTAGGTSHAARLKASHSWLHPQGQAAVLKAAMASFSGEDIGIDAGRRAYNPDFERTARTIVEEYVTRAINAAPQKQEDVKITADYALPQDLADKAKAFNGDHPHALQAITNAARKAEFIALDFLQDLRGIPLEKDRSNAR